MIGDLKRLRQLSDLMDRLLKDGTIGDLKPQEMEGYKWGRLKEIEALMTQLHDVQNLKKDSEQRSLEITAKLTEIAQQKEKRDRQLLLIQEVLNDPSRIERIEVDDDTFAPGNWANLRKLAQVLAKSRNHGPGL